MPTPLKQPIPVLIKHVENAVLVLLGFDCPQESGSRRNLINDLSAHGEVRDQIAEALIAQGINYTTWEPAPTIKVGDYALDFQPDGSVKAGCQTITRETLLKIKEASDAAMKANPNGASVESEWPKYFTRSGDVLRLDSAVHFGNWVYQGGPLSPPCPSETFGFWNMVKENFKPITRLEAEAFIKGEK